MPVFKTYLKIVRSKLGLLILYLVIFLVLSILISRAGEQSETSSFQETSTPIGVADRDSSLLSVALIEYLSVRHKVQPIADNKETMQDELYYNTLEYILIIPDGFEASYQNAGAAADFSDLIELENVKSPQSSSGYLIDTQLEEYLSNVRAYLLTGKDISAAAEAAADLQNIETETSFSGQENTQADKPSSYYFIHYIAYVMVALLILSFGPALLSLYRREVRQRSYCSATPLKSFNLQIILGCLFIAGVILMFFLLLWICIYQKQLTELPWFYILCNLLSYTIVCIGLGLLTGFLANSANTVNMISNICCLGFSFLGGIFIPQELLSSKILPVSRLLPSYWYAQSNNLLFQNSVLTKSQITTVLQNCGIQLAFAFAVFAAALLLSRRKMITSR